MASPRQPLTRSSNAAVVAVRSSRRPQLTSSIRFQRDIPDSALNAFRKDSAASQATPRASSESSRGPGSSYLSGGTDYFNFRKKSTASIGSLSSAPSCLQSDGRPCKPTKVRDMESLLPTRSRETIPKARPTGMTPSPHETHLDLQVIGKRPNASMRPGLKHALSRTESVQVGAAQRLKPTLKIQGYFLSPDASSPPTPDAKTSKSRHRPPSVKVGDIFLDSDTAEFYMCNQVGAYEHRALKAHLPVKLEQCYPNAEAYDVESDDIKFIQERYAEGKTAKARLLNRLICN